MRFLHTMIRVNDLDESIRFYCDVLEMKLIRKRDYPRVISRDEASNTVIELTYNWNAHRYDLGDAFGHLGLGVDDIYKTAKSYVLRLSENRSDETWRNGDRVCRRSERL